MFDIKQVEAEARKELAEERAKEAKKKLKDKLQQIAKSEAVTAALKRDYELLLMEVGAAG